MGPGNRVFWMGVQISTGSGNFKGKGASRCEVYRLSAVSCAKMAKPIEILFGIWTRVGPRYHLLGGDAQWRHLANIVEPSMRVGDVTLL